MTSSRNETYSRHDFHDENQQSSGSDDHTDNILDDYDLGQCIGRGGFATVYKATRRRISPNSYLPRTHAIKIMNKQDIIEKKLQVDRIRNEIQLHKHLHHINIVQYIDR